MSQVGVDILLRIKDELAQGLEEATRTMRTGAGILAKSAGEQLKSDFMPSMMGIQGAVVSALSDGVKAAIDKARDEFAGWSKDRAIVDSFREIGIAGGEAFSEGLKSIPIAGTVGDWLSQGFDAVTGGTMAQEAAQAASRKEAEQLAARAAAHDVVNKKIFDYLDLVRGVVVEEDQYQQMQEKGLALINEKYDALRKEAGDDLKRQRFLIEARNEDLEILQREIELRRVKDEEAAAAAQEEADNLKWLAEQSKQYAEEEKQRIETANALNDAALAEDQRRAREEKQMREDLANAELRLAGAVDGRATAAAAFRNDASQRVQAQATGSPAAQMAQAVQQQNSYFQELIRKMQEMTEATKEGFGRFPDFEVVS